MSEYLIWGVLPVIFMVAIIIFVAQALKNGESGVVKGCFAAAVSVFLIGAVLVPAINDVSPEELDVYVIAGQSNAAYFVYDLETSTPNPEDGTTFFYGSDSGPIEYGDHNDPTYDTTFESYSMTAYDDNLAHLESPFSATYTENTGKKVMTINIAVPGASITAWQEDGYAWEYGQAVLEHALDSIDTNQYKIVKKGFIWIQGESDYAMTVDEYKEKFLNTYDLIDGYGFSNCYISKVRCVSSLTGQFNPANPAEAQVELAGEYSYIHMATEIADTFTIDNGLMRSDNLHYNQLGQNQIGVALGEYCSSN